MSGGYDARLMESQARGEPRGASSPRADIEQLETQREEMDRELVRRAYRIHELEQDLQRLEIEFHTSFSWKITAPLRALRALIGKLLRR